MQFPAECSHERDQSRDSSDSGASSEPRKSAQALLRAYQVVPDLRAVLPGREQRHSQEIQEHGRQELRLPLSCVFVPNEE